MKNSDKIGNKILLFIFSLSSCMFDIFDLKDQFCNF